MEKQKKNNDDRIKHSAFYVFYENKTYTNMLCVWDRLTSIDYIWIMLYADITQ